MKTLQLKLAVTFALSSLLTQHTFAQDKQQEQHSITITRNGSGVVTTTGGNSGIVRMSGSSVPFVFTTGSPLSPIATAKIDKPTWSVARLEASVSNPAIDKQARSVAPRIAIEFAVPAGSFGENVFAYESSEPVIEHVDDAAGNPIEVPPAVGLDTRSYRLPLIMRNAETNPIFTVSIHYNKNLGNQLKSISGHYMGLRAEKIEHVDVPIDEKADPVEIVPGVMARFKKADRSNDMLNYQIETFAKPGTDSKYNFRGNVSVNEPLPEKIILKHYMVDAQGKNVFAGLSPSFTNLGVESSGMGSKNAAKAVAMRYDVAVNPKETEIPFELTDVSVPQLGDSSTTK